MNEGRVKGIEKIKIGKAIKHKLSDKSKIYANKDDSQPAVFSCSRCFKNEKHLKGVEIIQIISSVVNELNKWTDSKNYTVGHIKAFVECEDILGSWISSTGKTIDIKVSEGWEKCDPDEFIINFTAIILGADKSEISKLININLVFD